MSHRRITTAVTLAVLCGLVVVGAIYGFRALFAPLPSETAVEPETPCVTQEVRAGKRIHARDVTVSVFNAGNRAGLASETLASLADRGFRIGDTGNAPSDADVRFVQVWSTEEEADAARLVARQFGKNTRIRRGDLGLGIDVVVGNRFRGLVEARKSIRSRETTQVCAPTD